MNEIILTGRLTRDPDIKELQNGTMTKFSLAVDGYKDKTNFFNCTAFGHNAESMAKWLKKGTKIGVKGSAETGSYTNRDGQKVNTFEVVVQYWEFCESKRATDAPTEEAPDDFMDVPEDIDDEVPFA